MVNDTAVLDRVFHALGDPTRRGILEQLSQRPVSVSTLASPLDMSLAAVLQHVQVLEDCGLVSTTKVGRTRTCTLELTTLTAARHWLDERRNAWERHLDRLDAFLSPEPDQETTA